VKAELDEDTDAAWSTRRGGRGCRQGAPSLVTDYATQDDIKGQLPNAESLPTLLGLFSEQVQRILSLIETPKPEYEKRLDKDA